MSSKKPTKPAEPPAAAPRISSVIKCECTQCQATIPQQNVHRVPLRERTGYEHSLQRVQAYCEPCDTLYEVACVVNVGNLEPVGDVRIVTDPDERALFFVATAPQRGELQVA